MPASVWIINLVVLGAVLQADLGRRKINRFRLLRPIVLVAIVMAIYWKGVGSGGDAVWFELGLTALGVALGVAAGFIFRLFRGTDGISYSQAGRAYAALWVVVVAARLAFVYSTYHSSSVDRWLGTHRISADAVTAALLFMAAAMVLARTGTLFGRTQRLPIASAQQQQPVSAPRVDEGPTSDRRAA
jgi:hypothetical protein